jgi:hypothetical protein
VALCKCGRDELCQCICFVVRSVVGQNNLPAHKTPRTQDIKHTRHPPRPDSTPAQTGSPPEDKAQRRRPCPLPLWRAQRAIAAATVQSASGRWWSDGPWVGLVPHVLSPPRNPGLPFHSDGIGSPG